MVRPLFGWGSGGGGDANSNNKNNRRMDSEGANDKRKQPPKRKESRKSSIQRHSYSGRGGGSTNERGSTMSALRRSLPVVKTRKKDLPTLSEFLEEALEVEEVEERKGLTELKPVLEAIAFGCQEISRLIQRAQTDELTGIANVGDRMNIQGEIQQQLDVICNTIMLDTLCSCDDVIDAVASEEMELPRKCHELERQEIKLNETEAEAETGKAKFVAVVDPIDGSKNIDVSLPLGTIFGIFRRVPDFDLNETEMALLLNLPDDSLNASQSYTDDLMPTPWDMEDYIDDDEDEDYVFFNDPDDDLSKDEFFRPEWLPIQRSDDLDLIEDFLQKPSDAIAIGGYCLFSASTVLVLTLGDRVDGFTLDPDGDEFYHTHPDIQIPLEGPVVSFNEANMEEFDYGVQQFLSNQKRDADALAIRPTGRYIGALVADVHNVLFNGGIYGYPATLTNPKGKLRTLYEGCPMALILETAGGAASTGKGRILDIEFDELHDRTPMFLGSYEDVDALEQTVKHFGKSRFREEYSVIDLSDKKEKEGDEDDEEKEEADDDYSNEDGYENFDEDDELEDEDIYYDDDYDDDYDDEDDDYIPPWERLNMEEEEPAHN